MGGLGLRHPLETGGAADRRTSEIPEMASEGASRRLTAARHNGGDRIKYGCRELAIVKKKKTIPRAWSRMVVRGREHLRDVSVTLSRGESK